MLSENSRPVNLRILKDRFYTVFDEIGSLKYRFGLIKICLELFGDRSQQTFERIELLLDCYREYFDGSFDELEPDFQHCLETIMLMNPREIPDRAAKHSSLMRSILPTTTVLHDANEKNGFIFLDAYALHPGRFNKPKEVMIGNPTNIIDSELADKRIYHLKKVITNWQPETYKYEHHFDGLIWKFRCNVIPLFGTEEILVITHDLEPWQPNYWLAKDDRLAEHFE
jgi:hypothetical protein